MRYLAWITGFVFCLAAICGLIAQSALQEPARPVVSTHVAPVVRVEPAPLPAPAPTPSHPGDDKSARHQPPAPSTPPSHAPNVRRPAPADQPPPDQPQTPRPAIADGDKIIGFAIGLHHTDHFERYLQSVDQIADAGFNTLEIVTPVFQTDGSSDRIEILAGPGRGPTRRMIVDLINHAHRRGLHTVLMPVVLFTAPRGNEWRGKISPEYWGPWWESYHAITNYFIDIANETGVDVYCIGSELLSTETDLNQWRALIDHIRERYPGRLTYSTNWDHFDTPAFWKQLDYIGISGYWNLTTSANDKADPTDAELAERWREIQKSLLAFSDKQARQLLFTEVGYPSLPWALKEPWNYIENAEVPAAPDIQARGYASFLAAWRDLLDPPATTQSPRQAGLVAGVVFYEWSPYYQGGSGDKGYGVRGKPALDLLTNWLTQRARAINNAAAPPDDRTPADQPD